MHPWRPSQTQPEPADTACWHTALPQHHYSLLLSTEREHNRVNKRTVDDLAHAIPPATLDLLWQGCTHILAVMNGLKVKQVCFPEKIILRMHLEWLATPVSSEQIAETHFQQKKFDMMLQKTYSFLILLFI